MSAGVWPAVGRLSLLGCRDARKGIAERDGLASQEHETQHDHGRWLGNDGVQHETAANRRAPLVRRGVVDPSWQTKGVPVQLSQALVDEPARVVREVEVLPFGDLQPQQA